MAGAAAPLRPLTLFTAVELQSSFELPIIVTLPIRKINNVLRPGQLAVAAPEELVISPVTATATAAAK